MSTTLPKTVPVLEERHISGDFHMHDDQCDGPTCLWGHALRHFGHGVSLTIAKHALADAIGCTRSAADIGTHNDAAPPEQRVAWWSRAVESLGYARDGDVFVLPKS